jgi:hypothetical protein
MEEGSSDERRGDHWLSEEVTGMRLQPYIQYKIHMYCNSLPSIQANLKLSSPAVL